MSHVSMHHVVLYIKTINIGTSTRHHKRFRVEWDFPLPVVFKPWDFGDSFLLWAFVSVQC